MTRLFTTLPLLIALMAAIGCSSKGAFDTVPVQGTVTFDGKPVTEGTLDFVPVSGSDQAMVGKPAAAKINPDGTYAAGTYGTSDGVVPGKKRVRYSAPLPEDTRENANKAPSPFTGLQIDEIELHSPE